MVHLNASRHRKTRKVDTLMGISEFVHNNYATYVHVVDRIAEFPLLELRHHNEGEPWVPRFSLQCLFGYF